MKSASDLLHRTPWWALLLGGLAIAIALGVFTAPVRVMQLEKTGSTSEERRAIKREVDIAFSESAIDLARGVVKEMRDRTRDEARREELDHALEQMDTARENLREAGAEVLRAKREAGEQVTEAVRDAQRAVEEAHREAERAMKEAGVAPPQPPAAPAESATAPPEPPAAKPERKRKRITILGPGAPGRPMIDIDLEGKSLAVGPGPAAELPPEMRAQIREKVTGDLRRLGVGAGLILIFIPIFIITVISKIFIDRSRAAQRMAELRRKEAEYHRMSRQVTEAKLSALQAQVEPHFLYNTLASVQALTEVDPQRANEMTGHLIQYLRNALPKMRESVSTVGQEVELVRAYLNILQMRMGKRLAFTIDVPPDLLERPFPPLMLPSLVENAIKHGLEPQREGGEVRITGMLTPAGKLRLVVADTGRGFSETPGAGVGLANIRERLAALYGAEASLTMEASAPQGVRATIEVPRDGGLAHAAQSPGAGSGAAQAAAAATRTARTLAAMGTAERAWRKGLSFTFVVLVVVAAVVAGLGILGVATGTLPVHVGSTYIGGASGALLGTAGIATAFAAIVVALAVVLAVVYGLGFLFVGIAIFIPLVVLVALFPVLSPFLLVGLGIWWWVRRRKRKAAAAAGV